jgi:uncharacterized membrane-anchored protein
VIAKKGFWAAVALQLLVLLGMMATHGYTLMTGQPVMLKTAPVDPWDLFRGEYVILNYEISRLSPKDVKMAGTPYTRGQQVWVTLRKGDPYWTAMAVSAQRPQAGTDEVALRGFVEFGDGEEGGGREVVVGLRYGIEQYYVPEGEGLAIEQKRPELQVEVLVDSLGRPAMNRLFIEGKPVEWR